MKNMIKKVTVAATLLGTLATAGSALAATQYPGGGVWTYGATDGGAFSNYYHGSKMHSSTVVSRKDSRSAYSGDVLPKNTAEAYLRTVWGEKVAFYYNYW